MVIIMENKINLNNPDNYIFLAVDLCYIKGCYNPACWFTDEEKTFGLCDKHYDEICKEYSFKSKDVKENDRNNN